MSESSSMVARRLFVLTGIDAAGKSATLARVAARRPAWAVGGYDPEDWLPHPDLPRFDGLLERHPREVAADLSPPERSRFIADLVTAHWRTWVRPRLERGVVVLVDSYHLRFRAKAELWGDPLTALEATALSLPSPRAVLLLEIDPEEAVRRRSSFDRQECAGEPDSRAFVSFQRRLGPELRRVCESSCDDLEILRADKPREEVAGSVISRVEARLEQEQEQEQEHEQERELERR